MLLTNKSINEIEGKLRGLEESGYEIGRISLKYKPLNNYNIEEFFDFFYGVSETCIYTDKEKLDLDEINGKKDFIKKTFEMNKSLPLNINESEENDEEENWVDIENATKFPRFVFHEKLPTPIKIYNFYIPFSINPKDIDNEERREDIEKIVREGSNYEFDVVIFDDKYCIEDHAYGDVFSNKIDNILSNMGFDFDPLYSFEDSQRKEGKINIKVLD